MIGTTLGHYRITGELGAGGMGEVWRAEDEKLGREVALKVLPAEFGGDEQRLERFQREAKVLASLNHANIAHLYGLESVASETETDRETGSTKEPIGEGFTPFREGVESGAGAGAGEGAKEVTFLVMELVEGEDLSDRISRGSIPIDEAIPIARQITEALEAAESSCSN